MDDPSDHATSTSGRSDHEALKMAVMNEKSSPEILEFQEDLITRIEAQIDYQVRVWSHRGADWFDWGNPAGAWAGSQLLTLDSCRAAGGANRIDARQPGSGHSPSNLYHGIGPGG